MLPPTWKVRGRGGNNGSTDETFFVGIFSPFFGGFPPAGFFLAPPEAAAAAFLGGCRDLRIMQKWDRFSELLLRKL